MTTNSSGFLAAAVVAASASLGGCGDDGATGAGGGRADSQDSTSTGATTASSSSSAAGSGGGGGGGTGTGGGGGAGLLAWAPCGEPFQCASLEVPIEPAEEGLGTVALEVMRLPATTERRGTLVLVDGAPGRSSTATLVDSGVAIGAALGGTFDVVAMGLRGIDPSSPAVRCGDADAVDAIIALDTSPDTAGERAALDEAAEGWDAACVANTPAALLSRVGSLRGAQDLDLLREALGEEQLNVLGFSYGTYQVVRYAALHPDRLRAVVLAGVAPPLLGLEESFRHAAVGYQRALDRFFAWCEAGCAGSSTCFHGGEDIEAVRDAFVAARSAIEDLELGRRADRALVITLQEARFAHLSSALVAIEEGSADELLSIYEADALVRDDDGNYPNYLDASAAIWFSDHLIPAGYTSSDFDDLVVELAAGDAPEAARIVASEVPFWMAGHWSTEATSPPPPFGAVAAPPFLLLANTHDPSTPFDGAVAMRDTLDNGSYLVERDVDGHGALDNGCAISLALDFVDDPTQPPAASICP